MPEQRKELRPDPAFKLITNRLAQEAGLKVISAELPQSLTADLILEIPPEAQTRLDATVFSFLKGYQYAIVEFKGQNDQFTLHKFLNNLARTALFCLKNEAVPVEKVLNLYVCSAYPDSILGLANLAAHQPTFTNAAGQSWLWQANFFFQEITIVVCRDLPLEPRFYEWLVFAPANTVKWREFVRLAIREGKRELIEMIMKMSPKEFRAMTIDVDEIINKLDPEDRKHILEEWFEIYNEELPIMAVKDPAKLRVLFSNFAKQVPATDLREIIKLLSEEVEKKDQPDSEPQQGTSPNEA